MILKYRHTCLVVKDLGRAIKFYEGLGFMVHSREQESWGPHVLAVVKMRAMGTTLELIKGDWKSHICFEVNEFPAMAEVGPYVHEKITDERHTVFIRDPEGNLIELTKIITEV